MRINIFFEEWDPNWKGPFSQCDKEVFNEVFKEHFKERNFCMRIGPQVFLTLDTKNRLTF